MKETTLILLLIITIIGIISIIIVRLYYKDKEKYDEKERLKKFINSTQDDYDNERREKTRRTRKKRAYYTQAQDYANIIDSANNVSRKNTKRAQIFSNDEFIENKNFDGTTTLFKQRVQDIDNNSKNQVREVKKTKKDDVSFKKIPERINTQMIKDEQLLNKQVPMTEKQKEFISKDMNKLIVENINSGVKVVKAVQPINNIEEMKKYTKIGDSITKDKKENAIVEKTEKVTDEKTKEEFLKIAETKVEKIPVQNVKEIKLEKPKIELVEEIKTETQQSNVEKKDVTDAKILKKDHAIIPKVEAEIEFKVKEIKSTINDESSKENDNSFELTENVYNDDLYLILNKEKKIEIDELPENEFVTINSDNETSSASNELINSTINSIRSFRKSNVSEKPTVVEEVDDVFPDNYTKNLGDGIKYIGDTITITPIHKEEHDKTYNQSNNDMDKIDNKTDDENLSESFEKDVKEDYEKIEKKEKEKKRRTENTKKILGLKGINDKRTIKTDLVKKESVKEKSTLMRHKTKNDVEEVYINGSLFELKVGQVVMFDIKGETYLSKILKIKQGYIGVRYRSKKIWIKSNIVKKILK